MSKNLEAQGWANPAPAGLVALGIACFTFFAMNTGMVDAGATPILGIWLLGGFFVQVIVGVVELKEGNLVGGNVFTFFSGFFMFVTGSSLLFKFWMAQIGVGLDARIDGWAWLVLAIALVSWTPAYMKAPNAAMASCVIIVDVAVVAIALKDLGLFTGDALFMANQISGWALLIGGILALYVAAAVILNGAFGRTVLKCGGPMIKSK